MHLFQRLKQRQVRRRYQAALAIYVASHTYRHLSMDDQLRISDWVKNLIEEKSTVLVTFKDYELFWPVRAKAAYWAVAMKSLGIPPAIPGVAACG